METINRRVGIIALFLLAIGIGFAISFKVSLKNSVTPNSPQSRPKAASQNCSENPAAEQCPGSDGVLHSCHPADANGYTNDSICDRQGRVEMCGNKNYCCPATGGAWTTTMTACCVPTTWTPAENTVCSGTSFTQTSNCGTTRSVAGTKTDGVCIVCTDTTWTPNLNTVCTGTTFTQTSNCGTTRSVVGTKTDTTWTPAANTVCTGANLTQTGDCGGSKTVAGTKYCCSDSTWSPSTTSTCSENKVTQTSNCGNEREVSGTKTCLPDLSVSTSAYADDSRNKPGVYFIDKKITKVSRDQFYVYTMKVKNNGMGSANNFKITNSLTGQNQSLVAFVDGEERCVYDSPNKKFSCEIEKLAPKETMELKFRVKVAKTALNGKVIRNTVKSYYNNKVREGSVDTLVSSIVSCNEYCSNDSECIAGLACDVFSNKCRRPSCLQTNTCNCVTPTAVATVVPTATVKPSIKITSTLTATISPTESAVEFPDSSLNENTVDDELIAEEVTALPEAGIFDLPQTTIFGGGILLAILGLFLAL